MADGRIPLICVGRGQEPWVPSTATQCDRCGADLWVSNTMLRHVTAGELSPACSTCGGLFDDNVEITIHPDQHRELAEYGVLDAAHDLARRLNRRDGEGGVTG